MRKRYRSSERYRLDTEYRKRTIDQVRIRHGRDLQYPVYRALCKVRNCICNWRNSVAYHMAKARAFESRIRDGIIRKEKLEMEWGRVRAARKQQTGVEMTKNAETR